MKKQIIIILTALCLVFGPVVSSIPSQAFELTKENFDYERYADDYADLKAAFGYNRDALFNHYNSCGRKEGRHAYPRQDALLSAEGFDHVSYADTYPDVKAAFGYNKNALYRHYVDHGRAEGRTGLFMASEAVESRAWQLVGKITTPEMDDSQKIRAVHDWIVTHTVYDQSAIGRATIRECTAIGPIIDGKAICTGYSDAFDLCMGMLGIDCRYVVGNANGGSHAWNEVYVNGQWLSIDVTFDDPVPDWGNTVAHYKFFLLSQQEMAKTHSVTKRSHERPWDNNSRVWN